MIRSMAEICVDSLADKKAPLDLSGAVAGPGSVNLEPRRGELHIGVCPCSGKPRFNSFCLRSLALRAQRSRETIQRPAVFRELFEVIAINLFRLCITSGLEERRAEGLPNRVIPFRRLEIQSLPLDLDCLLEVRYSSLRLSAAHCDLAHQRVHCY